MRRTRLNAVAIATIVLTAQIAQATPAEHAQAVAKARAGQYEVALPELERLVQANPKKRQYRYDLVTVLSWAGSYDRALVESQSIPLKTNVPSYVLAAIGKSALAAQSPNPKRAVAAYSILTTREPRNADASLGLALAHLDDGNQLKADQYLARTLVLASGTPNLLTAAADALDARQDTARAEPFRLKLASLGLAQPSSKVVAPSSSTPQDATPTPASPISDLEARQKQNAQHIRDAEARLDLDFSNERYQLIDAAIVENEELISLAQSLQADDVLFRLRKDRVVALRDRKRSAEALAEFDALDINGTVLPPYVINAAADSAMQIRQPIRGRDLYMRSLQQDPESLGTRSSLMYAHLENEDFSATENVVSELMSQTQGALGTRRTQATIQRFADRLEVADEATKAMLEAAPNDAGIWLARADLLAARGLPRAAARLYADVLNSEPSHIGARVGLANATWAQGDIVAAAQMVKALLAEAPEHPAVQRLAKDWARRGRPLLTTAATQGFGQGRVSGNDDLTWETTVYSGQTDDGLRIFANHHLAYAKFNGDSAQHERVGTGIEWTMKDVQTTFELGRDLRNAKDTAWAAGIGWQINDNISTRARYESQTNDFPVKGRLPDAEDWAPTYLYASKTLVGAAYTWNESRKVAADLAHYNFNDGNRRDALSVSWSERLYSGYGRTLDLQTAAYTSRNTALDAIYFNPKQDLAVSATLSGDWQVWREYERSFNHRLAVTYGTYKQTSNVRTDGTWGIWSTWGEETYGWNPFTDVRYEHEWRWGPDRAARYGVGVRRFPYDGQYESKGYLYLQLTWRF